MKSAVMKSATEWDRVLASVVCTHGDDEHCSTCCIAVIGKAQADAMREAAVMARAWFVKNVSSFPGSPLSPYSAFMKRAQEIEESVSPSIETLEPKFKEGNLVRVKPDICGVYDLIGVVEEVLKGPPGRQPIYNVRYDRGRTKGSLVAHGEDEIDPYPVTDPKLSVDDHVRVKEGGYFGYKGIVREVEATPEGVWGYRVDGNYRGCPVGLAFNEDELELVEGSGKGSA